MTKPDGKWTELTRWLPGAADLPREDRADLLRAAELTTHAAGDVACPLGVPGSWLVVVLDGVLADLPRRAPHPAGTALRVDGSSLLVAIERTTLLTLPADREPLLRRCATSLAPLAAR